jgi:hypothetical protein
MTVVWNPNLLAVAGVMLTMAGLGLLARAVLAGTEGDEAKRIAARRRVDIWFAVPLGMLGLAMIGAAQVVSVGLTPFVVITMLALAFTLILYAMIEGSLVEALTGESLARRHQPRLAQIAPPQPVPAWTAPSESVTDLSVQAG